MRADAVGYLLANGRILSMVGYNDNDVGSLNLFTGVGVIVNLTI